MGNLGQRGNGANGTAAVNDADRISTGSRQWILPLLTILVFLFFTVWAIQATLRTGEERFLLEAETDVKVLEVAFGDSLSFGGGVGAIQRRIDGLVARDPFIVRLSFIGEAADGSYRHLASSLESRIGKLAHPEDLEALATGEIVLLEEEHEGGDALDITHPVRNQGGVILGLIGYTVYREKTLRLPLAMTGAALLAISLLTVHFILLLRHSHREIQFRRETEQALRDSHRIKDEFISITAHELRTPLAVVRGYAELLLRPAGGSAIDGARQREFIQKIFHKVGMLRKIIDDLLDVQRIESGQAIPLDLIACDPDEIIRGEVEDYRIHSPAHHFELAPGEQPRLVLADRNKIVQVLENLLSNAIKFSPDGGKIVVGGKKEGNYFRITVADEGIGMTPEQIEKIFIKFYRADNSSTAKGGMGLGMSIVRNIVDSHGGSIRVESEMGRGTTISFTVPLAD